MIIHYTIISQKTNYEEEWYLNEELPAYTLVKLVLCNV